jgi:hypothetical protein
VTNFLNKGPNEHEVPVACHVHSEWSYDGTWKLPALANAFARRGYRVVMMTEHDRGFNAARWAEYKAACQAASSEKILIVPGIEYSDSANTIHILAWGPLPFLGEGLSTSDLLAAVKQHSGVAVLAHPSRREAWRLFDDSWSRNLLGIEMWNRKTDGWAPSREARQLQKDTRLLQFAGLDFHTWRQFFPLSMQITTSGGINEAALTEALAAGRARPYAFKTPLKCLLSPVCLLPLAIAEKMRRGAASAARKWLPSRKGLQLESRRCGSNSR